MLPSSFGKYTLLSQLTTGSTCEIYLAKSFGMAGFERLLTIKKLLPSLASDPVQSKRFIDEAMVASNLHHSNIVQINELGKVQGCYYMAMEFVHGKNLRQMMERLSQLRRALPPPLAILILSHICEGLDYAHRRVDAAGQSLGIVHRHLDPSNVLISYAGDVKITDFGLARPSRPPDDGGSDEPGAGTPGYMSPEQANGLALSHRADIFSSGILLFELLTGQRLFSGETPEEIHQKVREGRILKPSQFVPELPGQLEEVLLRALAFRPEERFEWSSDFQQALTGIFLQTGTIVTGKQLSLFMQDLFAADLTEENSKLAVFRKRGYPQGLSAPEPQAETNELTEQDPLATEEEDPFAETVTEEFHPLRESTDSTSDPHLSIVQEEETAPGDLPIVQEPEQPEPIPPMLPALPPPRRAPRLTLWIVMTGIALCAAVVLYYLR